MVGREGLASLRSACLRSLHSLRLEQASHPSSPPYITRPRPRKTGPRPCEWWAGKDSNLRRHSQQIYSLPRLTASVPTRSRHDGNHRFARPVKWRDAPRLQGLSSPIQRINHIKSNLPLRQNSARGSKGPSPEPPQTPRRLQNDKHGNSGKY